MVGKNEKAAAFREHGFVVFREALPPTLIETLRRVTDQARPLAREARGSQAQRLQPVGGYDLDLSPFYALRELTELNRQLSEVIEADVTWGNPATMGVLLEPAEMPWCTHWHRDGRDNLPFLDGDLWQSHFHDQQVFNQCNVALYEDHSLWVVPRSHLRPDTPEEHGLFPERPVPRPALEGLSSVERERECLRYVRQMPDATQLHLEPGDFALYRNTLWHLGNYVPYARRATLHDFVDTPEFADYRSRLATAMEARKGCVAEWAHWPLLTSHRSV
jgi:ectoine hydroxylase-related dioxygenase (phytanoyl-CoA dioxygenase family)